MRTLAIALPIAALLATSGAALAADSVTGNITYMNPQTGDIALSTGQHYRISQPGLLAGVYPGQSVVVTKNDDGTIGFSEDSSYFDKGTSYGQ